MNPQRILIVACAACAAMLPTSLLAQWNSGPLVPVPPVVAAPATNTTGPIVTLQPGGQFVQPGTQFGAQPGVITAPPTVTAPPVITQPPALAAPAFPPPPAAAYDMYAQPGVAPYSAPAVGPVFAPGFSGLTAPLQPGVDPACGLPGFFAFAEVFWWDAHYPNTPYTFRVVDPATPLDLRPISTDFNDDTGFRIGVGWRFNDGWDVGFIYTDFSTTGASRVGDADDEAANDLLVLDIHPFLIDDVVAAPFDVITGTDIIEADEASERLALDLKTYDFEAGRKFCICRTLILRPFAGVRFAQFDHLRDTLYLEGPSATADTYRTTRATNIDSVGLRGGGRLSWNLGGSGLQVFSRGGLSLLYSDFALTRTDVFDDDISGGADPIVTTSRRSFSQIVPVAEIATGVRYEAGGFFISGGWELQNWFNVIHDFRYHAFIDDSVEFNPGTGLVIGQDDDVDFTGISLDRGDIGLGGWFIRGGYNF